VVRFTKDGMTCRACQGSCIVTRIAVVSVALTYGAPGACPGTTTALSPTTVHSQTVSRLYISGVPSAADSSSQDVRVVTTNVVCSSAAVQVCEWLRAPTPPHPTPPPLLLASVGRVTGSALYLSPLSEVPCPCEAVVLE
jgi:hypothetical protein